MRRHVLGVGVVVFLVVALGASRVGAAPSDVAVDRGPIIGGPSSEPMGTTTGFFVVNSAGGIPENGAVLIKGPYDSEPAVFALIAGSGAINSSAGVEVEGALTRIEGSPYWVWLPTAPLVAGTSIELQLWGSGELDATSLSSFTVMPALELAQPAIALAPSASLISVISEKVCCRARFGTSATLEASSPCFGIEYEASIQLDPGISTTAPRLQSNQYVFRFDTGPDARPAFTDGSLSGVVLPVFREQADEYCFNITAIELSTRTEYPYESAACARHGTLADLGVSAVEPGAAELVRNLCQAPPLGFEEPWCEVNADCEGNETSAFCGLYPHVCDGEPIMALPSSADPPEVRADAAVGDAGGGDDVVVVVDASQSRSGSGCGCMVVAASRSGRAALALSLAIVLALAASARRRHRSGPKCATGRKARCR